MNTIKKIVSGISILAILLMISITNAATPTAVINAGDITLITAWNNAWEALTTLDVKLNGTSLVLTTDYTISTATANTIVVTPVDNAAMDSNVTVWTIAVTTGKYQISYITTAWVAGSVYVVNDSSNDVVITAVVVPVLTMALASNAVDFWKLSIAWDNASLTDTVVTVSTNATSGLSISTSTTGWDTASTVNALGSAWTVNTISPIGALTNPAAFSTTAEYFGATLAFTAPTAWVALAANTNFSSTNNGVADSANNVTGILATTSWPTDTAVLNVKYHAGITSITEAWNYSATVVYSVTGTF